MWQVETVILSLRPCKIRITRQNQRNSPSHNIIIAYYLSIQKHIYPVSICTELLIPDKTVRKFDVANIFNGPVDKRVVCYVFFFFWLVLIFLPIQYRKQNSKRPQWCWKTGLMRDQIMQREGRLHSAQYISAGIFWTELKSQLWFHCHTFGTNNSMYKKTDLAPGGI